MCSHRHAHKCTHKHTHARVDIHICRRYRETCVLPFLNRCGALWRHWCMVAAVQWIVCQPQSNCCGSDHLRWSGRPLLCQTLPQPESEVLRFSIGCPTTALTSPVFWLAGTRVTFFFLFFKTVDGKYERQRWSFIDFSIMTDKPRFALCNIHSLLSFLLCFCFLVTDSFVLYDLKFCGLNCILVPSNVGSEDACFENWL